jgi:hypothetical protein
LSISRLSGDFIKLGNVLLFSSGNPACSLRSLTSASHNVSLCVVAIVLLLVVTLLAAPVVAFVGEVALEAAAHVALTPVALLVVVVVVAACCC